MRTHVTVLSQFTPKKQALYFSHIQLHKVDEIDVFINLSQCVSIIDLSPIFVQTTIFAFFSQNLDLVEYTINIGFRPLLNEYAKNVATRF
jgi:hypothetical protein